MLEDEFSRQGEPIPEFSTANLDAIDALVKLPQSSYFGKEQYPTIESKAAILFYTLNKKHLFLNGNKRMSAACLVIFLLFNKKSLSASSDALKDKALWLASTTHQHDFEEIKSELESWIRENMIDISDL